ncbi:hypothetical protein KSP39_PZI007224 [Platanthera zijinensis]|uniref:Uncharacterized protein n=1 Tax=Platanthera zijinensis TaxID=2320716 RepID=A0AAP0G9M0_9ASPA
MATREGSQLRLVGRRHGMDSGESEEWDTRLFESTERKMSGEATVNGIEQSASNRKTAVGSFDPAVGEEKRYRLLRLAGMVLFLGFLAQASDDWC